jgi:hypothetical protein
VDTLQIFSFENVLRAVEIILAFISGI